MATNYSFYCEKCTEWTPASCDWRTTELYYCKFIGRLLRLWVGRLDGGERTTLLIGPWEMHLWFDISNIQTHIDDGYR